MSETGGCNCGCGTVAIDTSVLTGTACDCGCGSVDVSARSNEEEAARLLRLRASIDDRLEELALESNA